MYCETECCRADFVGDTLISTLVTGGLLHILYKSLAVLPHLYSIFRPKMGALMSAPVIHLLSAMRTGYDNGVLIGSLGPACGVQPFARSPAARIVCFLVGVLS